MVKQHQQKHQKQQQQQQLSATKATIRDSITKGKWHNGNRLLKLVCFGRASEVSGYLSCMWFFRIPLLQWFTMQHVDPAKLSSSLFLMAKEPAVQASTSVHAILAWQRQQQQQKHGSTVRHTSCSAAGRQQQPAANKQH